MCDDGKNSILNDIGDSGKIKIFEDTYYKINQKWIDRPSFYFEGYTAVS